MSSRPRIRALSLRRSRHVAMKAAQPTQLPAITMRQALADEALLGRVLAGDSWAVWRALLIAVQGEPLTDDERALFTQFTGRPQEPLERCREFWVVVGRRGGKSRAAAVLAVYQAVFVDHSKVLVPGEKPVVLCLAPAAKQASIVASYIAGIFQSVPLLSGLVVNETGEALTLANGIEIEVRAASYRNIRGLTAISIIGDEAAFWYDDASGSSNSDVAIIGAAKPSLTTTKGLLAIISTPHARRGVVYNAWLKHYGAKGSPKILVAQGGSRAFNPTGVTEEEISEAMETDPAWARAEYLAEFRSDLEQFISREAIMACVAVGVFERPPRDGVKYFGFIDVAGGSGEDSYTAAIAHREGEVLVLDALREVKPPFSPEDVSREYAAFFRSYHITKICGDKSALGWPREQYQKCAVEYEERAKPKSDLYLMLLPTLNSRRGLLLDHGKLLAQFVGLERRTARGGRDSVDHRKGAHDDLANAVAGVFSLLAVEATCGFLLYYEEAATGQLASPPPAVDAQADFVLMRPPLTISHAHGYSGLEYAAALRPDGCMLVHPDDVSGFLVAGFIRVWKGD